MRTLDDKALQAQEKKAAIGPDINLRDYSSETVQHSIVDDLTMLSPGDRERMLLAGVDTGEKDRSGTFIQKDTEAIFSRSREEGLEIIPIKEALERFDWVHEYYWKLASVDADKYTARAQLDLHNGYVIRALPGKKVVYPVQACLYLEKEGLSQNVHNIIVAEEGSELHVITGCANAAHLRSGLHVGISEFFVKKNAKLSFTMIHHWSDAMTVRPRSLGIVEEGGLFLNNYISMRPVKSLQMYPTTYLQGKGAVARFYSLIVGSPGSEIDVGSRFYLQAEDTRAEILSRAITNGGNIIARGDLVGEVAGVRGHLECRGLLLNGGI
ncbi:MAG: SufD family Fe-S cluster assembly protein, partial [Deltaproteobacteria bacterium]|nr:SufD family Fe-S cluster assembly protein [Deltaproteobacteria bacterium]